jgi:anti-anti-sigma factor
MTQELFKTHCRGDTLIITAQQSIAGLASGNIRAEVARLLHDFEDPSLKNVVFDLSAAEYFGTYMLELVHTLWREAQHRDGNLALCNVSEVGREILHVARLDTLWPVFSSLENAVSVIAEQPLQEQPSTQNFVS